jgi:hypothetical protein
MSSRYVRGRPRILLESRQWAALSFFLFSCFFLLTLPLSDDYGLSLLSYLTGLLALLAVFRFRGPATVMGFLITLFVARYYFAPLLVKTIEGSSVWHNLYTPTETLSVLACSLLAMVIASAFFHEEMPVFDNLRTPSGLDHLRRLVVITSIIGIAAAVQGAMRQEWGPAAEVSTGFLSGAGLLFAAVLPFSLLGDLQSAGRRQERNAQLRGNCAASGQCVLRSHFHTANQRADGPCRCGGSIRSWQAACNSSPSS